MPAHPRLSRRGLRLITAAGLAGTLLASSSAFALPARGAPLPEFSARDLTSGQHASDELKGRPALVVIITDKDAGAGMRQWFAEADRRMPKSVHRQSLITLHLPFFVSEGTARGKAKGEVPRTYWKDTWLDKNGDMGKVLGLASSPTPYVLALDARGHVIASMHGTADSPEARSIWAALSR